MANQTPRIRATGDEALAVQLWGDNREYDADRGQWVSKAAEEPVKPTPVAKKAASSAGSSKS